MLIERLKMIILSSIEIKIDYFKIYRLNSLMSSSLETNNIIYFTQEKNKGKKTKVTYTTHCTRFIFFSSLESHNFIGRYGGQAY